MKTYSYILFICFLLTGVHAAQGQVYYTIPDVNMRNILIRDYPTYMNSNGQLDVAAAKTMSIDLNLDAGEIENVDGIQFFEKTGILRLRNNKVKTVPQLSYMKNLRRIYLNGNQITSLPNLSDLYQLIDLFVGNNKITSIAGTGIETKTTLLYLNVAGNNISEIPDLSALVNLRTLSVDFNPISVLPDLSLNTTLQQLSVGNTNISVIPSLPSLINLEIFNCDNSKMTDLSILNSNTSLIKLTATSNNLTALPSFHNKPNLTVADISKNSLTFEDLLPLASLATFPAFTYAPQKDLHLPAQINARESNNYSYQISIDPSISSNIYTWKKNNLSLVTGSSATFSFTPVFISDSGFYSATVTNPALPLLELKTNVSRLIVRSCIEVSDLKITTLSTDCREGSNIDLNGTVIEGVVEPVHYRLINTNTSKIYTSTGVTQFTNVIPGAYEVLITDTKNCSAKKAFVFDDALDCEKAFSPNGDGIMDNYFIDGTGTAHIYNTSKRLIKTIQLPGAWDGTSNNGNLVDSGYYVVIINESYSIGVSLMR